jgi:hypothetical protein
VGANHDIGDLLGKGIDASGYQISFASLNVDMQEAYSRMRRTHIDQRNRRRNNGQS